LYAGSNDLEEVAWWYKNSNSRTRPVGRKKPNELGLHDMSGNVWQWCNDWYGDYPAEPQINPTGPDSGVLRVFRGGGWFGDARGCRSAYRGRNGPAFRHFNIGFRLASQ
jgi:formylglycine-generating enzyme required for sulfatase activity